MHGIRTCLWFDGAAEAAARFYVGLIDGSEIEHVQPGPEGGALMVNLTIGGVPYMFLNGGPQYTLTPAVSIMVMTADQVETDRIWAALTADGGEESRCAWCVDRFGVSWQVVPEDLPKYVGGPDPEGARRATEAMFGMTKIDIGALKAAYEGA